MRIAFVAACIIACIPAITVREGHLAKPSNHAQTQHHGHFFAGTNLTANAETQKAQAEAAAKVDGAIAKLKAQMGSLKKDAKKAAQNTL